MKLQLDCKDRDGKPMECSRYDDWPERAHVTGKCFEEWERASQLHQDMQALEYLGCKKDGFYVDIGANDGKQISNTFVMDTQFSWKGLCVDPFPADMEQRSCSVLKEVVSNATGDNPKHTRAACIFLKNLTRIIPSTECFISNPPPAFDSATIASTTRPTSVV